MQASAKNLTTQQKTWLRDLKQGIEDTVSFIGELTEYHGGRVATEYLLTVHTVKALFRHVHPEVGVEYVISKIKNHPFAVDRTKAFPLGQQRFDVVVLGSAEAPEFVVEFKIGIHSLSAGLQKDLRKIMQYLDYLKPKYAKGALGACVFQTHVKALTRNSVPQTTSRIHRVEEKIRNGLKTFAVAHPGFEFDWHSFQEPNEGIYDDEQTTDVDGCTPMLGEFGYAARYHAILIRSH